MIAPLMRLQVPSHWAVCYNQFLDVEPLVEMGRLVNGEYFREDLLSMQSLRISTDPTMPYELNPAGWLADVGWYPSGELNGAYSLYLFQLDPAEQGWPSHPPLFRSPNRFHIQLVLEYLLHHLQLGDTPEASRQRMELLQRAHDESILDDFLRRHQYA